MAALMAHDGGSWSQAWPGPRTQAAPSGRKNPWAPADLGPPLPEKPFLLVSDVFGLPPSQDRRPGPRSACRSKAQALAARTRTRDGRLGGGSSQSQTTPSGLSQLNLDPQLAPPGMPVKRCLRLPFSIQFEPHGAFGESPILIGCIPVDKQRRVSP